MSASGNSLPALKSDGNLSRYLREIRTFPMLGADEEYMLAKAWREHNDVGAAHRLVTSHLRLVARIALGYRGYGLPLADLIAEGNIGMMQAVRRFDPDRGFRLATYALWWIKASIQEYILKSWSLVKIGTTAAQKRLFFNLNRVKRDMQAIDDGELSPDQVKLIAKRLMVPESEVVSMNRRLAKGGDSSLNAPVRSDDGDGGEWQDWVADDAISQEAAMGEAQESEKRHRLLLDAMHNLSPREQDIIKSRRLDEPPATLDDLSQRYGISRERVRQIEERAFEKLQAGIRRAAAVAGLLE